MSKIEIFPDAKDEWRFRVKAGNGRIVGPTEGFKSARGAGRGIEALKRALATATIVVLPKTRRRGG